MMKRVLMVLLGMFLCSAQAFAQQKTITGKVTGDAGAPLSGVSVIVKGTTTGTQTSAEGTYSIRAAVGQALQFRFIGTAPEERTIGSANVINVQLTRVPTSLDVMVVTALGQTAGQSGRRPDADLLAEDGPDPALEAVERSRHSRSR